MTMEPTTETQNVETTPVVPTPDMPEPVPPEVTPEETPTTPEALAKTAWYTRKTLILAIVLGIGLVGGAGYYAYLNYYQNGGTVAVVNGERIYRNDYDENLHLLEESAKGQGIKTDDDTFKATASKQALDNLINNSLLLNAAHASGIKVEDKDIDDVHAKLVESVGGEDALTAKMKELGLTEEKLHSNIEERILVDKYIESVSDVKSITVTDKEIQDFLDANLPKDGDKSKLPPLDQIRPVVEAQIKAAKQQDMVQKIVDDLRAKAKIDIRI